MGSNRKFQIKLPQEGDELEPTQNPRVFFLGGVEI